MEKYVAYLLNYRAQSIEHRAYWALQKCNLDDHLVEENRVLQINELDE